MALECCPEFNHSIWRAALRFGIQELLAFTILTALAFLAWSGRTEFGKKRDQLLRAEGDCQAIDLEIERSKGQLSSVEQEKDYYRQLNDVHQSAIESVPKLLDKYSEVREKPGWISYRSLLTLSESENQSNYGYRILVPKDTPVFLRTGFGREGVINIDKRHDLDRQVWQNRKPMVDSRPHEIKLAPGVHDVVFRSEKGLAETDVARFTLLIDGASVFSTVATDPNFRAGSATWSNPIVQHNFRLDKLTTKRGRYTNFLLILKVERSDKSQQFRFFTWLSSSPTTSSKFFPYDEEVDENE